MTRNGIFGKLKSHLLVILALIVTLTASLFLMTACNKDEDEKPSYSKVENDESIIANGSFEFGSSSLSLDAFPQTSTTGWTRATDNGATSSKVDSGIIDISDAGWKALMSTMYEDSDFFAFVSNTYGFNKSDIENQIKQEKPGISSKDLAEAVKDRILNGYVDSSSIKHKYFENFVNPGKHDGTTDEKVYMLNNYRTSTALGLGTAQKLTSSSAFNLDAGEYGKLSLWVKVQNFSGDNKAGANVRIINKFNSTTQAPYVLYGIRDTEWTKYTVYFKADEVYACNLQVVLGFGFGNGNSTAAEDYAEGTVYFDDVVFEQITEQEYVDQVGAKAEETLLTYQATTTYTTYIDVNELKANDKIAVYNMTYDSNALFTDLSIADSIVNEEYTSSSVNGTVVDILGADKVSKGTITKDDDKLSLVGIKNLAYNFTLKNNAFKLAPESYALIKFTIKNDLGKFDANGVNVFVVDNYGSEENAPTSVVNAKVSGEETEYSVLVKNNFPELDKDGKFLKERTFYIKIFVGPYALTQKLNASDFATGDVEISGLKIMTGKTYEFVRTNYQKLNGNITSYEISKTDKTTNYVDYTLLSTKASSTVSLYAGESANYSNPANDSYSLTTAPSEYGSIVSAPAVVSGYTGIVKNHSYINSESNVYDINTRSGNIAGNDHAGLINTKYLDTYSAISGLSNIKTALNHNGADIQPIMIYNDTASAYGFIGNTITLAKSSYKKISLDVKVTGDAKAYIYLVTADSADKEVMTIDVKSNTDGYEYTTEIDISTKKLELVIDSSMMDTTGAKQGWTTVTFYLATGSTQKQFRLEVWNGARDGSNDSTGYVFFNNVDTSATFTEPTSWVDAFTNTSSLLYSHNQKDTDLSANAVLYMRPLDATEIKYNDKQTDADSKVSYSAKYIWANNDTTIYAVFNSIDPVPVDPNPTEDEDKTDSGCTAETDPSTFWLSFSSIVLAAALVLAIVMLFIKNLRARRKANKNDAKSYYKVTSRYKEEEKPAKKVKEKKVKNFIEEEEMEKALEDYNASVDEVETEEPETTEETEVETEQSLDDYVYGDVQTFGSDDETIETNEDKE